MEEIKEPFDKSFFSVFRNIVLSKVIFGDINWIHKSIEKKEPKKYKELNDADWICQHKHYGLLKDKVQNKTIPQTLHFNKNSLALICQHVTELDLFKQIFQLNQTQFISESLGVDQAASTGNIEVIKFLDSTPVAAQLSCTVAAINGAASAGHLSTIQYLHLNHPKIGCSTDAMDGAAENGFLTTVMWLNDNRTEGSTAKALDMAAQNGHKDIVYYLCEQRKESPMTTHAINYASLAGYTDIVEYLLKNRTEGCTKDAMIYAASRNHLDVIKILCKYKCPSTSEAMDEASKYGYIDIVRYLHDHRTEGCTKAAMNFAAMGKHFEVVKFLNEHRDEGCTTYAMNYASYVGCLPLVEYLHKNRTEGCTEDAMDFAANRGHLDVVEFLHVNRSEGCTKNAMDLASLHGNLEVVKYLHHNRSEGCTTNAMNNACMMGHIEVAKFLNVNRTEGCTKFALEQAISHNRLDIVEFLVESREECKWTQLIERGGSIFDGKHQIKQYLQKKLDDRLQSSKSPNGKKAM